MSSKNTPKNSGQRARPSLPNGWGAHGIVRTPAASAPEASARPRLPNMWRPPPVRAPLVPLRADPRLAPLIIQPPPLVSAPPVRAPLAPFVNATAFVIFGPVDPWYRDVTRIEPDARVHIYRNKASLKRFIDGLFE